MKFDFTEVIHAISGQLPLETAPDFVRPVCIVSGDFYEMGVQYGQQQFLELRALLLRTVADIKKVWEDPSELSQAVEAEEHTVGATFPEYIRFWEGVSEGANLPYSAVLLAFISTSLHAIACSQSQNVGHCSTISAWGSETENGNLLAGTNADGAAFSVTNFSPVLLMFPREGNCFIANGGISSNLVMNGKGMVGMASNGGWNGRPDDVGVGLPGVIPTAFHTWKYATAQEAVAFAAKNGVSAAENLHFVDKQTGAYVLEHTKSHHAIRRPGENGEQDFLITTNHFISGEMLASRPTNDDAHRNSYSRFQTEMQAMKERHGRLTIEELGVVLSLHDRYESGKWYKDEWDPVFSYWTPEKHGPFNKTYMQTLAVPDENTFYIRQGQSDWRSSAIPGATGNFVKFILENTPEDSAASIEREAVMQLWKYARQNRSHTINPDVLNRAKQEIWYGKNCMSQSILCDTLCERMRHIALALRYFCRAQARLGMAFRKL